MTVKKREEFRPSEVVYTPPEATALAIDATERTIKHAERAMSVNIPIVKDYFAPVMPGQVAVILGQSSNFKSGLVRYIEREAAFDLVDQGRDNEVIVHISTEEVIEEQVYHQFSEKIGVSAGDIARGMVSDMDRLNAAAEYVEGIPIYRIGSSLARPQFHRYLYLSNIIRALQYLQENLHDRKLRIAGLFFDYLQAFPIDPEVKSASVDKRRRLQVREDMYRLKDAAAYFGCPVWVAVQAKQLLNGNPSQKMYIPGMYDGEETSSIAQRADRMISLWMPKQTGLTIGTVQRYRDIEYPVLENLLWMKVLKQRGGLPSGKTWPSLVDFNRNRIRPTSLSELMQIHRQDKDIDNELLDWTV
jgi:hypothetical protein